MSKITVYCSFIIFGALGMSMSLFFLSMRNYFYQSVILYIIIGLLFIILFVIGIILFMIESSKRNL